MIGQPVSEEPCAGNPHARIRGGTGRRRPVLPDRVGPDASIGQVPGTKPMNASGKTIVPGLIDLHNHSTFDADMRAYLKNGVTSIRFAGLNQDAVVRLRDRIERREVPGPRIFSCGPMLDKTCPFYLAHPGARRTGCDRSSGAPGLGSEGHPACTTVDRCGVADARPRKTQADRTDRLTGEFRVAGTPQAGAYAASRL
jgi:hypothetical protein